MRALLDTNIIIEFWKKNPLMLRHLQVFVPNGFIISAATEAELIVGALNRADLQKIRQDLQLLEVLPLTPAISQLTSDLLVKYTLSHCLSFTDALIAATALHHRLPLFTLNRKDFHYIAGL
ncbi:type II toxin-antitoxin system VapC family toxin [Hymenobacter sp.]|uniref:type II toxin-antitoxin system VapC family toxin n=1 Tax=Hymenobacter sp. TaxID=1898978 RepID=UPI00286D1FDF|nr:type II toxin-antitoxin system VapC family toxin [Hymenobacter sp.]